MHRLEGLLSVRPCAQVLQRYLCFQWRNQSFAFQGLPFGLNTVPRVFTKLIKPVAAYLRKRGIRIIVYLDDFLILGSSIKESRANTLLTLDLLQWLSFTINWEKSLLDPTQSLTFLSLSINSLTMSLRLPKKKILNIQHKCKDSLQPHFISSRSGKPDRHIGGGSPRNMASPTPLQVFTNITHKIPTGISAQLRDADVPEQQFSGQTTLVAPEHSHCQWQYHQPSSPHTCQSLQMHPRQAGVHAAWA